MIETYNNLGIFRDDDNTEQNVLSFQMGESFFDDDPFFPKVLPYDTMGSFWQRIGGYDIMTHGPWNVNYFEQEKDIKNNRLVPTLIEKQIDMLYGYGPHIYKKEFVDGKPSRVWLDIPEITNWFESWEERGVEMSWGDFSKNIIRRFYSFKDFFVKFIPADPRGILMGAKPFAALEMIENRNCALGGQGINPLVDFVQYKDFKYVLIGNWNYGNANYKVYPKFTLKDALKKSDYYIAHYRESAVGEFYGCNESYNGIKQWIKGSNESPEYINSFLKNSLAAKVHVVIPNEWCESKRKQIRTLCDENKKRVAANQNALKFNGIDIGSEYKESVFIQYTNQELRKLSNYLSGKKNQGKIFSSFSYSPGSGKDQVVWQINVLDLKYKEYIDSLISYDRRADEVITEAFGIDSSISSISKEGIISKSGSDGLYKYIIYLLSLTPDDEKCSEPFNDLLRLNFPSYYAQGYRIGFYRETPTQQQNQSPNDRLINQPAI
jgi:hypothetical protein